MPFVILDALEGEEDVCPQMRSLNGSPKMTAVSNLCIVAAIKGTPVPRGDLLYTQVSFRHRVFGMLVYAE
jgi:hypothetical protein